MNPIKHKIILDVDTGTDDAVAIMIAALSPEIDLIGITTVNGNKPVEICTNNTLRVLEHINAKHIPVYQGCSLPIYSTMTPGRRPDLPYYKPDPVHGMYLPLKETTLQKQDSHAVNYLIDTFLESDGDITLVAVGPLTNVGLAIKKNPLFLEKIKRIVIMGGGHEIGNSSPSSEFNIWVDPEAAKIVMKCGASILLIPLDATHQALISYEDCKRLHSLGTPASTAAAALITQRIMGYDATQPMLELGTAPVHDALAVCAILDPTVITSRYVHVDVETKGSITDGRTVCDTHNRSKQNPNVHVAFDSKRNLFLELLTKILGQKL